jgi:predicted ATPase
LRVLDEALMTVRDTGERWWEAELYRLKGELLLRHAPRKGDSRTAPTATATVAEVEIGEAGRLPAVVAAETCLL